MSTGHEQASDARGRSDLDRRVVEVTGHLLMAGIWVERQLKNLPERRHGSSLVR